MEKEEYTCNHKGWHKHSGNAGGGAVYGLGLIGALVYYVSTAGSFGAGALGILKALVWPGFVVYEIMKFLQM